MIPKGWPLRAAPSDATMQAWWRKWDQTSQDTGPRETGLPALLTGVMLYSRKTVFLESACQRSPFCITTNLAALARADML